MQNYGLKRRHLHKFAQQVETFYKRVIVDKTYKSDLVVTYQKRFVRYKDSLFTFLTEDGIPWHNNTAERAIRPFAIQREISKSPLHDSTTYAYLVVASFFPRSLGLVPLSGLSIKFLNVLIVSFHLGPCIGLCKSPMHRFTVMLTLGGPSKYFLA